MPLSFYETGHDILYRKEANPYCHITYFKPAGEFEFFQVIKDYLILFLNLPQVYK
jgi:hypothetical protein